MVNPDKTDFNPVEAVPVERADTKTVSDDEAEDKDSTVESDPQNTYLQVVSSTQCPPKQLHCYIVINQLGTIFWYTLYFPLQPTIYYIELFR